MSQDKKTTPAAEGTPKDAPKAQATPGRKDAADKRRYVSSVIAIRHNGQSYAPGDELLLTAEEAQRLGGLVQPASKE